AAVSQREPGSTALYPPALHDALPILDRAIFTPAIKAEVGEHDENVSFDTVAELHGPALAARLRELTLELYERGRAVAEERGILLADTKFEFGRDADGSLVLADEVFTPDS